MNGKGKIVIERDNQEYLEESKLVEGRKPLITVWNSHVRAVKGTKKR